MLDAADIQPGETHLELGAGDGRFCVEAEKRGARSTGYEIDPDLAREAPANIVVGDYWDANWSQYDVITASIDVGNLAEAARTKFMMECHRPGSRLVIYLGNDDHPVVETVRRMT
jgi:SAM-dependent methyltransferase